MRVVYLPEEGCLMTCTQSSLAAAKDELEMSCDDKGAMEQSFSVRAVGEDWGTSAGKSQA